LIAPLFSVDLLRWTGQRGESLNLIPNLLSSSAAFAYAGKYWFVGLTSELITRLGSERIGGFQILKPEAFAGAQFRIKFLSASVRAVTNIPISYNSYFNSSQSLNAILALGFKIDKFDASLSSSYGTSGLRLKSGVKYSLFDWLGFSIESDLSHQIGTYSVFRLGNRFSAIAGVAFAVKSGPGIPRFDSVLGVRLVPPDPVDSPAVVVERPHPVVVLPLDPKSDPESIDSTAIVTPVIQPDVTSDPDLGASPLPVLSPDPSPEIVSEAPSEIKPVVSNDIKLPTVEQKKVVFDKTELKQFELIEKWQYFLKGHPEIELVSINFVGGKMSMNEGYNRIKKVKEFLISSGVEKERIRLGKMIKFSGDPYIRIDIIRIRGE
jgi:hypothetical protein